MTDNTERAEYERRIEEVLDDLQRHADFHCRTIQTGMAFPNDQRGEWLPTLRLLARHGRLDIHEDHVKMFRGRWIPIADRKPLPAPTPPPLSPAPAAEERADATFGRFVGERYMLPRGSY